MLPDKLEVLRFKRLGGGVSTTWVASSSNVSLRLRGLPFEFCHVVFPVPVGVASGASLVLVVLALVELVAPGLAEGGEVFHICFASPGDLAFWNFKKSNYKNTCP